MKQFHLHGLAKQAKTVSDVMLDTHSRSRTSDAPYGLPAIMPHGTDISLCLMAMLQAPNACYLM